MTTTFPNARLCKAMLDRLTGHAHFIETGATARTIGKVGDILTGRAKFTDYWSAADRIQYVSTGDTRHANGPHIDPAWRSFILHWLK